MKSAIHKVIIIGGTGFIGYHTAKELLKSGYSLTSLAVPDVSLQGWYPGEISLIEGDVFSMSDVELREALAGHDAMVYAVGPDDRVLPDAPALDFFREKLVEACGRVFQSAQEAGIKRAVLLGSYLSYFHRNNPELRLGEKHTYILARLEQEERVLGFSGKGMDVMVLELPYIFGTMPERVPLWKDVFLERFRRMNPVFYSGGGSAMVCVENVAEGVRSALEKGTDGKRYPLAGENITWKEMFGIMFDALGVKKKIVSVPHWMASPVGMMIRRREQRSGKEQGLHTGYIFKDILSRKFYLDYEKCSTELGYGRCDVRQAIANTARACYPGGYTK